MKKFLLIIPAVLLMLPGSLFADWGCFNGGYGTGWHCYGGGFYGGGFIMIIFNLLLIFFLVVLAVKLFRSNLIPSINSETPLDILKKRLARGEISKDEFEDLKKVL